MIGGRFPNLLVGAALGASLGGTTGWLMYTRAELRKLGPLAELCLMGHGAPA